MTSSSEMPESPRSTKTGPFVASCLGSLSPGHRVAATMAGRSTSLCRKVLTELLKVMGQREAWLWSTFDETAFYSPQPTVLLGTPEN